MTNQTGGTISGLYAGVLMGFPSEGSGGGTLLNQATGAISGDVGIIAAAGSTTVTNAGSIAGTTARTISHQGVVLSLGDDYATCEKRASREQDRRQIAGLDRPQPIGGFPSKDR